MELKKLLIRNSLASGFGKMSTVLFRFVQVPLLLFALGTEDYGRWLVLYSFPSWIALANLGFGSVAANEVSMAIAAEDEERAHGIFATVLAMVTGIAIAGSVVTAVVAPFIPWEFIFRTTPDRHSQLTWAVIWFAISTLLSFFGEVYTGRFRAARKAHLGIVFSTFRPWLDLVSLVLMMHFTKRFDYLALAVLGSTVAYLLVVKWYSWRALPTLVFSRARISASYYRLLLRKGLSFQAFPLGNALLFQGNLLIVQMILGPTAVAIFGTVRTLVRSINQMLEMVNQIMWPELSLLFGAGKLQQIARLHRIGVAASIVIAVLSMGFLALFGNMLYGFWTGNAIPMPQHLLLLFLLPIPFNALWFTSSVTHMASNQHEPLAVRYLMAAGLSALACVFLSIWFGIEGAAISTLVGDIILIPYVFVTSLKLTDDTWSGFVAGLRSEVNGLFAMMSKVMPGLIQK